MSPFAAASLAAYIAVLGLGALRGNRIYSIFAGVILGIHTLSAIALWPALSALGPVAQAFVWFCHGATYVYFTRLGRAPRDSRFYQWLVAWPASFFAAGVFLAIPWAILESLGFHTWLPWLPFAVSAAGFLQSLTARREVRRITLDRSDAGPLRRFDWRLGARRNKPAPGERPLRLVQITDPHLGTFMSEARLHRICERAVAEQPDLILLTGDFLTMDTQHTPEPLARALAPLRAMPGRVFACFGNHDHECPDLVRAALRSAGVELLVDRAVDVELPWGPVQIVGADHRWRDRDIALRALAEAYPRKADHLRLWLLHDPGAFHAIPEGEADLVLSGHTHGGHLGLLSLGLSHTIVSAATRMPDHGVWARGRDRLYVHRGNGHYGFPLRVGVPAEESVLEVIVAAPSAS
jgi:predicted MPP superfamily phosphohydrolase